MNENRVTLIDFPLIEVDFGRFTVGDVMELARDSQYCWKLMTKLCVQDLGEVPFSYASVIVQRFTEELTKRMNDLPQTHELFKRD